MTIRPRKCFQSLQLPLRMESPLWESLLQIETVRTNSKKATNCNIRVDQGSNLRFSTTQDCSTDESLHRIPAFVDAKNDRVYALQGKNTALVSWIAAAEGPDDTTASVAKLHFRKPAVSMNVMSKNKGVVYGTLSDNGVYVATWSGDGASLKFQTFDCPVTVDGTPCVHHHDTSQVGQSRKEWRQAKSIRVG